MLNLAVRKETARLKEVKKATSSYLTLAVRIVMYIRRNSAYVKDQKESWKKRG
jgi:hypothetical protein